MGICDLLNPFVVGWELSFSWDNQKVSPLTPSTLLGVLLKANYPITIYCYYHACFLGKYKP